MGVEEGTSNGDGSECSEGVRFFQSDVVNNGFEVGTGTNMGDGSSGASECIRTYKRRKHLKSTMESKLQEDGRPYAEAASQLVDQVCFPFYACIVCVYFLFLVILFFYFTLLV